VGGDDSNLCWILKFGELCGFRIDISSWTVSVCPIFLKLKKVFKYFDLGVLGSIKIHLFVSTIDKKTSDSDIAATNSRISWDAGVGNDTQCSGIGHECTLTMAYPNCEKCSASLRVNGARSSISTTLSNSIPQEVNLAP